MALLPSISLSTRSPGSQIPSSPTKVRKLARIAVSLVKRVARIPGWSQSFDRTLRTASPTIVHDPYLDGAVHGSGLEVFYTPELLRMILILADWPTIMAMSRTSQYARFCSQLAVRALLKEVLDPFVGRTDFVDFVRMMDATGCGITGSVARRLLYTNSKLHLRAVVDNTKKYTTSKDLNIVVPNGHIDAVKAWFVARGVPSFEQEATQMPYSSVVKAFYRGKRPKIGNIPVSLLQNSRRDMDCSLTTRY